MKLLILSDSHRTMRYMHIAVDRESPNHIIHLGDHNSDADKLQRSYPMIPVLCVRGNCDYDITCSEQVVTEFEGYRFFIAHGHRYGVKNSLLSFELAARETAADVALFGHTHRGMCETYNGLWLLNPGSCGSGSRPSYGIVEILNGKINCRLVFLD